MTATTTGLRVLLVEDNPAHARLVMLPFTNRGVEVEWAHDGTQAIDLLTAPGAPYGASLVLLDLRMPGLSGFDVLDRVRHCRTPVHIPIVVLSTSSDISDMVEAYQRGANAYLVKPTDIEELNRVVDSIVDFWLLHNQPTTWP